ncbi:MAG: F0F1 ATP synthase subunit A [Phycisphaeraceae bacterium]
MLLLAASDPIEHVADKPIYATGQGLPWFLGSDGSIWWVSNVTLMLVLSAIVTAIVLIPAARRIDTGKQRTIDDFRAQGIWANLVEAVCLYLRDDVFRGVLGDQTDRYTPMLWTLFWFILICNLMGLIPIIDLSAVLIWGIGGSGHGIGGTATQSIWVTGALALISSLFYMGAAVRKDPIGFLKHLTGGAPWFMWPIMIPVEIMGYIIKPFALAIRLFANMTGGHLVIAVLLSFVPAAFGSLGTLGGSPIALISILGAVGINMLEVLVAFIQAFIFTFLTCLFLGQLVTHEHHEHDEEDADDHGVHMHPHNAIAMEDIALKESHIVGTH